jgi:hypothetical protein
MNFTEDQ